VPSGKLLPGAIDDSIARQAMKEMNVSSPLVRIKAVPLEKGFPIYADPKHIEDYVNLFKI
jgi:hypothetical protein